MIRVMDLPLGWALYAVHGPKDVGGWVPVFRHKKHGERSEEEIARMYGARSIFHALKRQLDIMDHTWNNPGEDPRFKAADKAKLKLEIELEKHGKWSWDLLDTGVVESVGVD